MLILQAPYPLLKATTCLPNPEFQDGEGLVAEVATCYTATGARYAYVKKWQTRKKLTWQFVLTREKGAELIAFLRLYHSSQIKITDHNNRVWVGYFTEDPDLATVARAAPGGNLSGERQEITLQFEGTEQ